MREIREEIYVDGINMGGNNVEEIKRLKETAINIFKAVGFELHKWHSNEINGESTFAKESLGVKELRQNFLE